MRTCKTCGNVIPGNICVNPKCGVLQPRFKPKTFEQYKAAVNVHVTATAGVGYDDLPDYYDLSRAWDLNKDPKVAARQALKASGFK